jgi:hypothetical protein
MGWENADWAPGDGPEEVNDDEDEGPDLPYCIHQHPVFLAARALGIQASTSFRTLLRDNDQTVPPLLAAEVMLTFWDSQHNVVMAVNATDTGDLPLAIVHMKRALSGINTAIGLLQSIPTEARLSSTSALEDTQSALFDLRDVCLRVISDCRWGTEE